MRRRRRRRRRSAEVGTIVSWLFGCLTPRRKVLSLNADVQASKIPQSPTSS